MGRRELEGTGYHYLAGDDDCLLVEQWIKRPDDLKGQAVSISKLLPREVRCENTGSHRDRGYREKSQRRNFRFRIVIEIEDLFTADAGK